MDGLAARGVVALGGPLGDEESFLIVIRAVSAEAARASLDPDPWLPMGLLRNGRVQPWRILLGALPDI